MESRLGIGTMNRFVLRGFETKSRRRTRRRIGKVRGESSLKRK